MILTRFFMSGFDRRITILIVLLLLLALLVPILHLMVPPTSFFHVPTFMVALLG
jgi:urea transport system permease protein